MNNDKKCNNVGKTFAEDCDCPNCQSGNDSCSSPCPLVKLIEIWERIAASWMQISRDRADDAPDVANRAQARAAIYQDCAEDLKANKDISDT